MTANGDTAVLDLPPGFTGVGLRELGDAFGHACGTAAEAGAGTLVWVRRFDSIEAAVVLEPEQALPEARLALYAGMNAVADALAVWCPPEKPLQFAWPDTILLDGGILGGCRLGLPPGCGEFEVPDWMVLGLQLRSVVHVTIDHGFDKGTSLASEGFEMLDGNRIVEGFARHLMAAFDSWRASGFAVVAERYLARLQSVSAAPRTLDRNGDLLERRTAARDDVIRRPLTPALATPQWLDRATGEPWM